jgi:hypothetical protein
MKIDGRCHCGKITYEAEIDPETLRICHCTDCQRLTGSPFRAVVMAPSEGFVLRSGEPKIYVKIAESGTRRGHAFCPDCGTPLYASALANPPSYTLRLGSIDQRAQLPSPRRQIWCRSALPWAMNLEGIERTDRQ